METTCDMQRGIWDMLEDAVRYIQIKKKRSRWNVSVIKEEEARECLISEKKAKIEIRDAFNTHLVIQRCEGKEKKIVVYIPRKWEKKITVRLDKGTVTCFQQIPCKSLSVSVKKGKVIYEKEEAA